VLCIANLPSGPQSLVAEYCSDASGVSGFLLGMGCSAHAAAMYSGASAADVLRSSSFASAMKIFEKALIRDTYVEREITALRAQVRTMRKTALDHQEHMEAIMVAEQQYFRTRLREQHSELTAERDALARELEVQRRKVKKYKSRAVQSSKVKDIDPCCEQDLEEVN